MRRRGRNSPGAAQEERSSELKLVRSSGHLVCQRIIVECCIFGYLAGLLINTLNYLPTLRLFFDDGVCNDYRLRERRVEFRINEGPWRILDDSDVAMHYRFNTEVAHWLHSHLQPGTSANSMLSGSYRQAREQQSTVEHMPTNSRFTVHGRPGTLATSSVFSSHSRIGRAMPPTCVLKFPRERFNGLQDIFGAFGLVRVCISLDQFGSSTSVQFIVASKLPSCEIHLRIPRTFWLWSIVGTGAEYLSENNCRFVGFCWDGIGALTIAHGFHAFRNLLAQCVAVRYESFGILNQGG